MHAALAAFFGMFFSRSMYNVLTSKNCLLRVIIAIVACLAPTIITIYPLVDTILQKKADSTDGKDSIKTTNYNDRIETIKTTLTVTVMVFTYLINIVNEVSGRKMQKEIAELKERVGNSEERHDKSDARHDKSDARHDKSDARHDKSEEAIVQINVHNAKQDARHDKSEEAIVQIDVHNAKQDARHDKTDARLFELDGPNWNERLLRMGYVSGEDY